FRLLRVSCELLPIERDPCHGHLPRVSRTSPGAPCNPALYFLHTGAALFVDAADRIGARMRALRAPDVSTDTANARAEADLLADRVPLFAGAWRVLVAVITVIEMLQGRLHAGLALAFLALHAAILGAAVLGRATPHARAL